MSGAVGEEKAILRREFREKVKRLSPEQRAEASARIRARLLAQPLWSASQSILFFVPAADEPDVWPLVLEALAVGKTVVLPRYSGSGDLYLACQIRRVPYDLEMGRYGLREPAEQCPVFNLKQLDLALVPGIAFRLDGSRLGRGKGYYDRLLSGIPGMKCGVAFDCQVAERLPLEPHDVQLNVILTPTYWHSAHHEPGV
jgi:5-formyltetrahydrofolate cyclo-ligase